MRLNEVDYDYREGFKRGRRSMDKLVVLVFGIGLVAGWLVGTLVTWLLVLKPQ
jgi:uncharacterized membrane protein YciS (DUF1049 family)